MGDLEAKQNELEILESIFSDLISFESENKIRFTFNDSVKLLVTLPEMYPSQESPQYELSSPSLSGEERKQLISALNNVVMENMGSPIIHTLVTLVNDFLENRVMPESQPERSEDSSEHEDKSNSGRTIVVPIIHHGEVLTDRKSHFQAHIARVHSENEVKLVLERLLENPKIARATHNIYAYRITESKDGRQRRVLYQYDSTTVDMGLKALIHWFSNAVESARLSKTFSLHDCFDDGETGASSKMLQLLEKMKADNVLVVVSRWYGGIHLGPDRFRHITNLTYDIVSKFRA